MGTDTMRRKGARRSAGVRVWMTGELSLSTPRPEQAARPPYAFAPDDPQLALLRHAAAARLRPVCEGMDDASFAALVARVAEFRLRWAPR